MKPKQESWSPWGIDAPYLKVPHALVPSLSFLGLNSTEILIVMAIFSRAFPDSWPHIKVSNAQIVQTVGCNERTVRRTFKKLRKLGLATFSFGVVTKTPSVYDVTAFLRRVFPGYPGNEPV